MSTMRGDLAKDTRGASVSPAVSPPSTMKIEDSLDIPRNSSWSSSLARMLWYCSKNVERPNDTTNVEADKFARYQQVSISVTSISSDFHSRRLVGYTRWEHNEYRGSPRGNSDGTFSVMILNLGIFNPDHNFVARALLVLEPFNMTTDPQSYYFGIHPSCGQHVRSGYGWKCTVCNRNLRESDLTDHVQNSSHKELVLALASKGYCLQSILSRRTIIAPLENRLAKLEETKWQLYVKGLLFDYLSTGDNNTLNKVKLSLNNYEHRGRLSLLELAVWKAASISYAGHVELDSKMSIKSVHDAILCAATHQHTWKKYRTEAWKSNAIEIITKQVLPFLDKP
jgi:hypothetical protein